MSQVYLPELSAQQRRTFRALRLPPRHSDRGTNISRLPKSPEFVFASLDCRRVGRASHLQQPRPFACATPETRLVTPLGQSHFCSDWRTFALRAVAPMVRHSLWTPTPAASPPSPRLHPGRCPADRLRN